LGRTNPVQECDREFGKDLADRDFILGTVEYLAVENIQESVSAGQLEPSIFPDVLAKGQSLLVEQAGHQSGDEDDDCLVLQNASEGADVFLFCSFNG